VTEDRAQIRLKIYDGSRQPFSERQEVLLRVHNGQTTQSFTKTLNTKSLNEGEVVLNVDFFDNFADNYNVLVSADGYRDAGFFPVRVARRTPQNVSLMLIPSKPALQFEPWDVIATSPAPIAKFLSLSSVSGHPQDDYNENVESRPRQLACLLNLVTAMSQIFLANGTPLVYFRGIEWDTLAEDRFFGLRGSRSRLRNQRCRCEEAFRSGARPFFLPWRCDFQLQRNSLRRSQCAAHVPRENDEENRQRYLHSSGTRH